MPANGLSDEKEREQEYERLVEQVVTMLDELVRSSDISRAELARRLGRTRGYVSQVLGGKNLTLRTVNDFAHAVGARVELYSHPLTQAVLPSNVIRFDHVAKDRRERTQWVGDRSREIRPSTLHDRTLDAPAEDADSVAG